jgi:hypothetical protein
MKSDFLTELLVGQPFTLQFTMYWFYTYFPGDLFALCCDRGSVQSHCPLGRQVGKDLVCVPAEEVFIVPFPMVIPTRTVALLPTESLLEWLIMSLLILLTSSFGRLIPGACQHFLEVDLLSTWALSMIRNDSSSCLLLLSTQLNS